MKHIESEYDNRLIMLVQCLDNLLGTLALKVNEDPDLLLYKSLYQASIEMLSQEDPESIIDRTFQVYPALRQLITKS